MGGPEFTAASSHQMEAGAIARQPLAARRGRGYHLETPGLGSAEKRFHEKLGCEKRLIKVPEGSNVLSYEKTDMGFSWSDGLSEVYHRHACNVHAWLLCQPRILDRLLSDPRRSL